MTTFNSNNGFNADLSLARFMTGHEFANRLIEQDKKDGYEDGVYGLQFQGFLTEEEMRRFYVVVFSLNVGAPTFNEASSFTMQQLMRAMINMTYGGLEDAATSSPELN